MAMPVSAWESSPSAGSPRSRVGPFLPRTLDPQGAGDLLAVTHNNVRIAAGNAVPTERGPPGGFGGARGGGVLALNADGDDRVLVFAGSVVVEHDRRIRGGDAGLAQFTAPELEHFARVRESAAAIAAAAKRHLALAYEGVDECFGV